VTVQQERRWFRLAALPIRRLLDPMAAQPRHRASLGAPDGGVVAVRAQSTSWRPAPFVRAISVAVLRRESQLLVTAVRDDRGSVVGWRPVGGTIEFGEPAADALRREFREELGEEICDLQSLCVLENVYTQNGAPGHEIVFVFRASFADAAAYRRETYEFADGVIRNEVRWLDTSEFLNGSRELFPGGLIRHLQGTA
jgi:ADP-ribose pyrophosphatase YjhB (NUDIX family)